MKNINKTLLLIGSLSLLLSGCFLKGKSGSNELPGPTDDHPSFSSDGKSCTYGYYPQSVVNDVSVISELDKLKAPTNGGWYLYNGDYYVKINATPWGSLMPFNNGELIVNGKEYWFKCEPITWKVLELKNGRYFILSEKLLEPVTFYSSLENRTIGGKTIYPNNYEYSDLRNWLNNDFYTSAFRFNDSYIQITNVDNSASTTKSNTNPYCCNNTDDKVFLLSYKDYMNTDYGFIHDVDKRSFTTEWARARGSYANRESLTYKNSGYHWNRSPYPSDSTYSGYVSSDGYADGITQVDSDYYSVRPAMNIKIA